MEKEIKRIVRAALRRGWTLTQGGKHNILIHPSGRKVPISMSPSCPHASKHVRADIERVEREEAEKAA